MKNKTYRELLEQLKNMSSEELDQNITVYMNDEYYPVSQLKHADLNQDVLDLGHFYLSI